jgi:hypothetical protein
MSHTSSTVGAGAGFLSEGQAAIDARPSLAFIREPMSKRRCQGQATRASVMPQAVLPVRVLHQLDVQSREQLQGSNADGRTPGATFLPEVLRSSRISLATIHAQMAMGRAQRRQAQQPQQPPGATDATSARAGKIESARLRPMRLARIMSQQTEAWRAVLATAGGDVHMLPGVKTGYRKLVKYDQERDGI